MTVKLLNQKQVGRHLRDIGSPVKWVGVEFDFNEVAVVGPKMPIGAIPVEMLLEEVTAWNGSVSETLVVGDSGSANRYFTAIDLKATAGTFRRLSTQATTAKDGYRYTSALPILCAITHGGTSPSAGKARLYVGYILPRIG